MYLTFDEYEEMEGSVNDASFPRYEHKARALIDLLTFGRLVNESPVRDAVKYACFDLIEAMHGAETFAGGAGLGVSSMSNDGVSVTFAGAVNASSRYSSIVKTWLAAETTACGVPLLYMGVDA